MKLIETEKHVVYQQAVFRWQLDAYYAVQRCSVAAAVVCRLDHCTADMIHVQTSSQAADDDRA